MSGSEVEYVDSDETMGETLSPSKENIVPESQVEPKMPPGRKRRLIKKPAVLKDHVLDNYKTDKNRRVNVVCQQTGKSMVVFAKQLSLENGEPLVDIVDGIPAIFETKDGTTYDVKVRIKNTSTSQKNKRPKTLMAKQEIEGDTQQLLDSIDNLIEESKETPRTSYKQRSTVGTPQVGTSCTSVERDLLIKLDKKLDNIDKKLDVITNKLSKAESKSINVKEEIGDGDDKEYKWNDVDLLDIQSRDIYAYARALLDTLFTKQEQRSSIVLESNKTLKPPLDKTRVQLLFKCVKKKYGNDYKHSQLLQTLNQKCRDAKV